MNPTKITQITLANGKTIPVIPRNAAEETEETKTLRKIAAEAGHQAYLEALAHGLSVTIAKDGKLVRVAPNGEETIIGTLS